ncbi:MAG: cob(I)yrinic acid a,c-diamide adenosyltransferase [Gammaproteobacteria bacterium]|nr:cob(I)yrinic acid a,c-diamide adenosyltransferase [Gammaproteobacteria bacterium]
MGHRLTRIYTRTGDDGTTGLATGQRVAKDDPRIEANGNVDETSSAIALILAEPDVPPRIRDPLLRIQNELFDVGAEFALPGYVGITAEAVERIEQDLDALNADLPPLKDFILPGGPRAAAACHLARAVSRRAERSAWTLARETELNPETLRYLNRLSDLLFVAARCLTLGAGRSETLWTKRSGQARD